MKKYLVIFLSLMLILSVGLININKVYADNEPIKIKILGSSEISEVADSVNINANVNIKDVDANNLRARLIDIYKKISLELKNFNSNLEISNKNISIYDSSYDDIKIYQGSLTIYIKSNDVNLVDEITSICLKNGATNCYCNNYDLINKNSAYKKALNLAIKNAKDKMASISSNYQIVEICEENIYDYNNYGTIKVTANVSIVFKIIDL